MKVKNKLGKKLHSAVKAKEESVSNLVKDKEEHADPEEKALTLPDLKTDSGRFTCYSSIISRGEDQPVPNDDLDRLQMELEFMLSAIATQNRLLHSQVEVINAAEESKPKKPAHLIIPKAKKQKEQKWSNTDEVDSGEDKKDDSLTNAKLKATLRKEVENMELDIDPKSESPNNRQSIRRSTPVVPATVLPTANNDISNKFWEFVNLYCGEVEPEHVEFFEMLIQTYDNCDDYFKVPSLGRKNGDQGDDDYDYDDDDDDDDDNGDMTEREDSDESESDSELCGNSREPGFVVKRLISALIELEPESPEKASTSARSKRVRQDEDPEKASGSPNVVGYHKSIKRLKKEFAGFITKGMEHTELEEGYRKLPLFHSPLCVEARLRSELEKAGFMKSTNVDVDDTEDVLRELKICQKELKAMMNQNKTKLDYILNKLKYSRELQAVKKDIKDLNSEVSDMCLKTVSLQLSKKELCPREVISTWKLLKNREILLTKLTEMQ